MARSLPPVDVRRSSGIRQVVPSERVRYLAEITEALRNYHAQTDRQSDLRAGSSGSRQLSASWRRRATTPPGSRILDAARRELPGELADQIAGWPAVVESYSCDEQVVTVRDRETHTQAGPRVPIGQQGSRAWA